jgi:hypothetical protein
MHDEELDPLIDRSDLDGLVRLIDARCETRDWEGLFRIRERAQLATQTGRQVWPAATLAEYRLALHASTEWAAKVLQEDAGRFTIGPLTEVVAQNHSWHDLQTLLAAGPRSAFIAHERAIRGEVIDRASVGDVLDVLDLPLELQAWEPTYPVATYSDNGIDAPSPSDIWRHEWTDIEADEVFGDMIVDDPFVRDALRSLVEPWTSSSGGQATSVVVDGTVNDAMSALGYRSFRVTQLTTEQAVQWLAWSGSSGGTHGRRRGAALGRFGVWWLLAAIGGFTEDWDELRDAGDLAHEVGDTAQALRWFRVDTGGHYPYELALVAEDPDNDIAVALLAHDPANSPHK